MNITKRILRALTIVGLMSPLLDAGCMTCEEQVEAFCERCDDQSKTAYECTYTVTEQTYGANGVAQFLGRQFVYRDCAANAAELEATCQGFCNNYYECKSVKVWAYDCSGDQCDGGDEAGLAPPSCDPNWFVPTDVSTDPTSGTTLVATSLWLHLLAEPDTLDCDGAWLAPDVTGAGFVLHDVTAGTLAAALGLEDGDLMVSANGMPLSNATEVNAAFSALHDQTTLQLAVERRGSIVWLDYARQ
ncbi:MAG: hypothetical protein H6712_02755 [Myxococcales bacterium]|nr:hypothetical protein [Myxococcales bacterium]MCB9712746.1 hypothetical protein [Myxococcales bacterium]